MKGVQFNWSEFLCTKFLENCFEAREQGKTFHYAWLLLSIMLVAREFPDNSQFPIIDKELLEATKYALLWATKDARRIHDIKIF